MSEVCRACHAPLVWAMTKDGKRAPITAEPKPDGNVLVFKRGETLQARVFAGLALDELRAQGVPMRLNHFADCPQREQFAKR